MIKLSDLKKEVIRLAEENPDFIYGNGHTEKEISDSPRLGERCYYLPHKGKPGCIMGQALGNLGFPKELLKQADSERISIFTLLGRHSSKFEFDMDFKVWFSRVQQKQDQKNCWGNCIS